MTDERGKVPVRRLLKGERLQLLPLSLTVEWFQVHATNRTAFPHLEHGCLCERPKPTGVRPVWEGYLLGRVTNVPAQLECIRLPRSVFFAVPEFRDPPANLRGCLVTLEEHSKRGPHTHRVKVAPFDAAGRWMFPTWPNAFGHALNWWTLPEDDPYYRGLVYDHVFPRIVPDLTAPTVDGEPLRAEDCGWRL